MLGYRIISSARTNNKLRKDVSMRYTKHGLCGVCGVYMITNTANGKRYVGSSVNVGSRISQHFTTCVRKYRGINEFYSEIFEYGRDAFEIKLLESCTRETKLERERYWFDELHPEYNMVEPDDCPLKHESVKRKSYTACHSERGIENRKRSHQSDQCREKCRNVQRKRMIKCIGRSEKGDTPVFESLTQAAKWLEIGGETITRINHIRYSSRTGGSAYGYRWEVVK